MNHIIKRAAALLLVVILVIPAAGPALPARAAASGPSTELPAPRLLLTFEGACCGIDPMIDFLTASGDRVYFLADDGVHGRELWVSDGTEAGTHMVIDLYPGADGFTTSPYFYFFYTFPVGAHDLIFLAPLSAGADYGYDYSQVGIYRTDGTAAGTVLLHTSGKLYQVGSRYVLIDGEPPAVYAFDIASGATTVLATLNNDCLTAQVIDQAMYITVKDTQCKWDWWANAGNYQGYLWKTDGTPAGTLQLGAIGMTRGTSPIIAAYGQIYFIVKPDINEPVYLWKSDGTQAGTGILKTLPNQGNFPNQKLAAGNGLVFFTAVRDDGMIDLWQSDGTEAGTNPMNVNIGISMLAEYFFTYQDTAYFFAAFLNGTGYFGRAWYKTRGIDAGGMVKVLDAPMDDTPDPDDNSVFSPTLHYNIGEQLLLNGDDAGGKDIYWLYDGVNLTALLGSQPYTAPNRPAMLGSYLLFTATSGDGNELWVSDLTPAGTALHADLNPGPTSSLPLNLTQAGWRVFFTADDGVHGRALWVQDLPLPEKVFVPMLLK